MRRLLGGLILAAILIVLVPTPARAYSYAEWAIGIWSARYGLNADYMVGVAQCESSLDPTAYNSASGATGLFQFVPATFYWLRDQGLNQDPTYVEGDFTETRGIGSIGAQAHVAAWAFAHGYGSLWSCG